MSSGRQLRSSGRRSKAPRRVYPGYMGRPYFVRSLAELSVDLASAAQAVLPPGGEVRGIFDVPPQEFPSWATYRYGPRHALIFTSAGVIHAQTAALGQPAQVHLVPTTAIHYVQVGQLLLYGRLEIGYAANGQAQHVALEFNTVGWDLLQPVLRELLRDVSDVSPPPPVEAQTPVISAAEIERLPFKFASGLQIYTLAPGERLLALAFQPGLWTRRLLISRRQVAPAIVMALTDRHVSLIEEERALTIVSQTKIRGSRSGVEASAGLSRQQACPAKASTPEDYLNIYSKPSYGWTFIFVPRHGVTGMRSGPAPLGRLVSIEMLVQGASATHELEITTEMAASWEAQWRDHGGRWYVADENGKRATG